MNCDTEHFTGLVKPIAAALDEHARESMGVIVQQMTPGLDVDQAAEANKIAGWERRETKKNEAKGKNVLADYSHDFVSIFINWNWQF